MIAGDPPAADQVLDVAKTFGGQRHQAAGRDVAGLAVRQGHARPLALRPGAGSLSGPSKPSRRTKCKPSVPTCGGVRLRGGAHRRFVGARIGPVDAGRYRSCRAAWRTRRCHRPAVPARRSRPGGTRAARPRAPRRASRAGPSRRRCRARVRSRRRDCRPRACADRGRGRNRGPRRSLASAPAPRDRHRCGSWRRRRAAARNATKPGSADGAGRVIGDGCVRLRRARRDLRRGDRGEQREGDCERNRKGHASR